MGPMRVLCTAGHVDHGKSTLVAALTGSDPDRLAEEKRRGLTIDLGFAWTTLNGIGPVAFVDLPGHERFVANMLAGAGPLGIALLVVAADEGWMPQSAEHLDILNLLDVRHGVVALTRSDTVDAETLQMAGMLVSEELAGSGLADAPVVAVSAVTGDGMAELVQALRSVLAALPDPVDRGRPRLWVDRSFSVTGAGTVVTGTLTDGTLATGQTLHTWPADRPVRVRALQMLEQPVKRAGPGSRVAVNLAAVQVAEIPRGSMLGIDGQWVVTAGIDAWGTPLPGATLGRKGAWTVHVGTAAVPAVLFPTGGVDLPQPGGLRVELAEPLPLAAGDRFVLRESGRGRTLGGGRVLDPAPGPRPRGRSQRQTALVTLSSLAAAGAPPARLSALVTEHEELSTSVALALAGASDADTAAAQVRQVGGFLMAPERWTVLERLALRAVTGTHQRRPALSAVDRQVPQRLLASAGAAPAVVAAVLDHLVDTGKLEQVPGGVRIPGHQARLTMTQQVARTKLLDALDDGGVEAGPLAQVAAAAEADDDLLGALVAEGEIVLLGDGQRAVSRTVLDAARRALEELYRTVGPFTAAQARDTLGTSRKYVLPLLEAMDTAGITIREGDLRRISPV